jgi:hypothetical protein
LSAAHDAAPQQEPEHEPMCDEEQWHDEDDDEVGGTEPTRLEPKVIALIESSGSRGSQWESDS